MNPLIRTTVTTVALLLAAASAQSANLRYTYSAAGDEVIDSQTGLTWRRCSEGQTWSGATCTGTADTYTHEQALSRAQTQSSTAGWRLPNIKELASIADKTRISPAIDVTAFPVTPSNRYWSSTPNAGNSSSAWVVYFGDGYVDSNSRNLNSHVRLVR